MLTQKNILRSVMVVGLVSSPLDVEKSLKSWGGGGGDCYSDI